MKRTAKKIVDRLRRHIVRVWQARSHQILPAVIAAIVLFCVFLFVLLADRVTAGATLAWDERILRGLRRPDDPAEPIGPYWLREMCLDITALGSSVVLTFFITASIGFLYFERQRRVAAMTVATTAGGALLSVLLKAFFLRGRPQVVPHLRNVFDPSFPSGHSMGAAVVFLTLGVMFMKSFRSRRAKAFCLFWAVLLTLLVGITRVYLGVHYPSDVLGGWIAGTAWALTCWSLGEFVPSKPLPDVGDVPRVKAHA